MKTSKKNTDWTALAKWAIIIAGILIVFSFLAPILFTQSSSKWDFTETGQIGDTIGGIMNPFIALGGVVMTFLAFYMQIRANKLQREQFFKSLKSRSIADKIDCYYKLQLVKNDLDKAIQDIDQRTNTLSTFKRAQNENPYGLNVLNRSLLKHYDRLLNIDRLSIFKGFKIFFNSTDDWLNKFNNLYNATDYIPEAFKEIYRIVDEHNKEIFDIKNNVRLDLIALEEHGVNFINSNGGMNTPTNNIVRNYLNSYRAEVKRSNTARNETNFVTINTILQDLCDKVIDFFSVKDFNEELSQFSNEASHILIIMNSIVQKSDQLDCQLEIVINSMIGTDNTSVRDRLNDVSELIGNRFSEITLEQLQNEYNSIPEN